MCIFRGLPRNLQKQTRARLSHLVERTHVASLLTASFPTHECDLQINNKLPERDRRPKRSVSFATCCRVLDAAHKPRQTGLCSPACISRPRFARPVRTIRPTDEGGYAQGGRIRTTQASQNP